MESLSLLTELDAIVDLSFAGVLKPDPKAYTVGLDALGLPPGQVLFVDDQPRNVAGAESVGMRAVTFQVTQVERSVRRVRAPPLPADLSSMSPSPWKLADQT